MVDATLPRGASAAAPSGLGSDKARGSDIGEAGSSSEHARAPPRAARPTRANAAAGSARARAMSAEEDGAEVLLERKRFGGEWLYFVRSPTVGVHESQLITATMRGTERNHFF